MEFFNKKQDVISLQLTQFGRYLLSQGLFQPEYYSFHDSDILYNSLSRANPSKNEARFFENQNNAQGRIKETPTIKPQISFHSLEKEHENSYVQVIQGKEKIGSEALQPTAVKSYAFPSMLGSMNVNSSHAPAFNVTFLKGHISGSSEELGNGIYSLELKDKNGGKNAVNITQIETDLEVVYIDIDNNLGEDDDFYEYEDGSSEFGIKTKQDEMFILLKVLEENTIFERENFDMQVFEIVNDDDSGITIETLRPLSFDETVKLDDTYDYPSEYIPDRDATYVSHYFDVLADEDIGHQILCEYDPAAQNDGVFADKRTKICQDLDEEGKKSFDIYEDETDYPGEVC